MCTKIVKNKDNDDDDNSPEQQLKKDKLLFITFYKQISKISKKLFLKTVLFKIVKKLVVASASKK